MFSSYLQELSELKVAKLFLAVVPEVQTDELTVPVEGNVVVYCGLAEDITCILWSTNGQGFSAITHLCVPHIVRQMNAERNGLSHYISVATCGH